MLYQQSQPKRYHRHLSRKRQEGVVIVVALFIVALVAAMAYAMMARLERDTRRTSLILRDTQAEFYAQGSIAWAKDQLRNNLENKKPNKLVDVTPIQSPENEMHGYKITSTIYDMQSRFNVNNLSNNTDLQKDFKKLLRLVEPTLTEEKANEMIRAVVDWIKLGASQSADSKYYLELPLPYRAAHKPLFSISELRLVKGVTPKLYMALQPHVIALSAPTLINVQSASALVLATLSPTMTLEAGKAIEQLRAQTPFVSTEQFLNLDIVKNHPISADKITIVSSYFLVETTVAIENQQVVLYTLLERTAKDNKVAVNIVWQSKGTW